MEFFDEQRELARDRAGQRWDERLSYGQLIGGPRDGDVIEVPRLRGNMHWFARVPVMTLDETSETVDFSEHLYVNASHGHRPLDGLWPYGHSTASFR